MSNELYFTYLRVELLDDNCNPWVERSYGFSVYDDYGELTSWGFEDFGKLKEIVNINNIIGFLESITEDGGFAKEAKEQGMDFNGKWYNADELVRLQTGTVA